MRRTVLLLMAVSCLALAGCRALHYRSEILLAGDYRTEQVEEAVVKVAKEVGLSGTDREWLAGEGGNQYRAFGKSMMERAKKYHKFMEKNALEVRHFRAQKRIQLLGPPSSFHIGVRKDLVAELLKLKDVKVYVLEYYVEGSMFPG